MNQARRRALLDSWWAARLGIGCRRAPAFRIAPREADALALGSFHPWIIAARAEASNVARVAKAQAALRHAHRRQA
jgi:hypothetical protein